MKTLFSVPFAILIGFSASNAAFAQRSGGGGRCQHSQPTSSGYTNTQSYGSPLYPPQAYMQNAYQQQQLAFMQRAYMQQAYLQQQSAMLQAAAASERQIQADQAERQAKIRETLDNRKAEAEKKRAKRAEQLAADKADKKVD
jgi:hypothetical protein